MASHEDKLMKILNKNLAKITNQNKEDEDEFEKFDKEEIIINFD